MRFVEAGQTAVAKLGVRWTPNIIVSVVNNAIPAINAGHSILIELFCKWNSIYRPIDTNISHGTQFYFFRNAGNEALSCWKYRAPDVLTFSLQHLGAWDETTRIPCPKYGSMFYLAELYDRTNLLKKVYAHGQLEASGALIQSPDFSGGLNTFRLITGVIGNLVSVDKVDILYRLTTMTACPAGIDAAIKRMYMFPMALDAVLAANAVIASQWDLTTDAYGVGAITTLADTGIVGGFPLTSSVDVRPLLKIVERP